MLFRSQIYSENSLTLKGGRGAPATLSPIPGNSFDKSDTALTRTLRHKVYAIDKAESAFTNISSALDTALQAKPKQSSPVSPLTLLQPLKNPTGRTERLVQQIDDYTQKLLTTSASVRDEFMKNLKTDSLENYKATVEPYRKTFAEEIIGRFDRPLLPANPRTRLAYRAEKWDAYEVVLDVFPDIVAYGLLLLPHDLKPNERRPVVVCQHGLEGRPQDTIGKEGYHYYKAFAAELANRGYITFAPQKIGRAHV